MKISTYHVNAFANDFFAGNPAMVCILKCWLPDSLLQKIAIENNLPVTTFLVCENEKFFIRWFTPDYELELCGHGTLAAGHIIFNKLNLVLHEVVLHSPNDLLTIKRQNNFIELNLPIKNIETCCASALLTEGLGKTPKEVYRHKKERYLAIFENEDEIKHLKPQMDILSQLEYRGITVSAPGSDVDFVSRVFYPKKTITEDAVTGASHCMLVSYWSKRLNKTYFKAQQLSARGGELICELVENERVVISGEAIIYMEGSVSISI